MESKKTKRKQYKTTLRPMDELEFKAVMKVTGKKESKLLREAVRYFLDSRLGDIQINPI